jgi:hypothetical protein
MNRPNIVWGNAVNMGGIWFSKPCRMTSDPYVDDDAWWDPSGEYNVTKLGTNPGDGWVEFASVSKEEAEAWTAGALAVMALLREWSEPR